MDYVNVWKAVSEATAYSDVYDAYTLIMDWMNIYRGKQEWLKYSYVSLDKRPYERTRKTLNAAKLITSELARLVWSENPEINTDESIADFLDANNFNNNMARFSEYGLAAGGFALKLYGKDNKLGIDFVPAECFIPVTWDNVRVTEADFIDRMARDGKVYVRVESHRKTETGYRISYKIYEESGTTLVKRASSVIGEELNDVEIPSTVPLFTYIKCPEANNLSVFSPLGVSMYANAVGTLESLDVAFDALSQEIVLGKKRIIVPAQAVKVVVDPTTGNLVRYFDPSDEVYQAFDAGDAENMRITDTTVEMRIDEIRLAIQTLLDILAVQTGMSVGAFSFDGVSMKTATEVISESSKTYRAKQSYENQLTRGIIEILEAIRTVAPLYGMPVSQNEYNVTWNDSIIEDRNSKTDYWIKRLQANTADLETVLMELDGLTEDEAKVKAADIRAKTATVDINTLFQQG